MSTAPSPPHHLLPPVLLKDGGQTGADGCGPIGPEDGRRRSVRDVFLTLGMVLSRACEPRGVARAVLQAADDLCGWEACALDLCNDDGDAYSLLTMDTVEGQRREVQTAYHAAVPGTMFRRVLEEGPLFLQRQTEMSPAAEEAPPGTRLRPFGDVRRPSRSLLFVPIRQAGQAIGMMTIQSYRAGAYVPDDLEILQALADYASGALSRTFTEEKLRRAEQDRERMMAELERSNEELEQFALAVAHDMGAPLRAIDGYLRLLQRRFAADLPAEAAECIGHATQGAGRLRAILHDLLAWSRVDACSATFRWFDPVPMLEAYRAQQGPILTAIGAELEIAPLPRLWGDPSHLLRVFENLLSNAMKYRSSDPLRISVSAQDLPREVLIRVEDNGVGIPASQREAVFAFLHRLHPYDEIPGTGMGLPLCRRIVERHHGRIRIEESPAGGTAAVILLPQPTKETA